MGDINKEKMSGKYSPEGYAAYLVKMQEEIWERSGIVWGIIPKDFLYQFKNLEFEGKQFWMPNEPEEFLTYI